MKKKFLKRIMAAGIAVAMVIGGDVSTYAAVGMNVQYHSIEEIKQREAQILPLMMKNDVMTNDSPSVTAPYNLGTVSSETLGDSMTILNFIRYVAGIPYDVEINEDYQKLAQGAALISSANGMLSHSPSKPVGMEDSLYGLCSKGAGSTNLGMGHRNVFGAFMGWMDDLGGNMDRVGHRRWCLNPTMKYTGVGIAEHAYSLYAFDRCFDNTNYSGVAWPAQNTPLELVSGPGLPWSISFGKTLLPSSIRVTLQNKKSGRSWNFSSSGSAGDFYVNNANYGQVGCVIFCPQGIEKYEAGDTFSVTVTGQAEDGSSIAASYDVNFFIGHQHTGGTATCRQLARCVICGDEYGSYSEHNWGSWQVVKKATAKSTGLEERECEECWKTESREIPQIIHKQHSGGIATCSELAVCDICGEEYGDYGDHMWMPWFVMEEATAKSTGQKIRMCMECGKTESKVIPKLTSKTKKISLSKSKLKLKRKKTYSLKVKLTPSSSSQSVKFASSNAGVAAVSANGQIRAISAGTAVIKVSSGSKTASCKVTVPGTTQITNVKSALTLKKGKSTTLHPKLKYVSSKDKITYKSSDPKVVSVTAKGVVKAKKKGTAIITVVSGTVKKQCKVTVK